MKRDTKRNNIAFLMSQKRKEKMDEFQDTYGFPWFDEFTSEDGQFAINSSMHYKKIKNQIKKHCKNQTWKQIVKLCNDFYYKSNGKKYKKIKTNTKDTELIVSICNICICKRCSDALIEGGLYCEQCWAIFHHACYGIDESEEFFVCPPCKTAE